MGFGLLDMRQKETIDEWIYLLLSLISQLLGASS
jgi:hypothetical protein